MANILFAISSALLICLGCADLVRKNVENLSKQDILNLQKALRDVVDDHSPKGYDAIAAYHGYPPQCKDGDKEVACCVHGGPNFPTWHRLLVVQIEQALKEKGLSNGVPYWDWTQELDHLPELVRDSVVPDSSGGKTLKNPWYQGDVHVGDKVYHTSRAVDDRLYQHVSLGEYTELFEQVLHAFEYTSFCQFAVQFEIAHSFIHSLVGGRSQYSLSSLDYTLYDPIFFLHHSNVDRLYIIYQEVQKQRGFKTEEGNFELCNIKEFLSPLEPFSRDSNPFPVTKDNSSPQKALDYHVFGYSYDSLTLNGLDAAHIVNLIKERQSHDRAFADFRLHNIGSSADIRVKVCHDADNDHETGADCVHAGDFFILGGPIEMDWSFERPYHFEITKTVESMGLSLEGSYHVEADVYSINGTKLPSDILPHPTVNFRPAAGKTDPDIGHNKEDHEHEFHKDVSVRKNVDRLTKEEVFQLREALEKFQNDRSVDGYQAIAEFHGDPGKCPFPTDKDRFACCVHGMPTFPHWHRLLVVQVEDSIRRRGSPVGVPYWDWTKPNSQIPDLAADEKYTDPHTGEEHNNPFHDAEVAFLGQNIHTTRDVQAELKQKPKWGDHTELFDAFLLALEQDNFCDFEVQFEIAHNLIHGLVGGNSKYGLSSLSYSAFDPIFYLHHSNIDRIWAIWIALQQHRHKPYKAHCAQSEVHTPLKPFSFSSPYNNDEKTFSHSTPTNIYDYEEELGYAYDTLEFGGMGIIELDNYINSHIKNKNRIFASILLHGIKKSGMATIYVTPPVGEKYAAGHFALLGGPSEMPWSFDRVYKHDITHALEALHLHWAQPYDVTIEIKEFDGTPIDISQFPHIDVKYEPAEEIPEARKSDSFQRKNVNQLNPEEIVDIRHALTLLEEDKSVAGYQTLGRFHGATNWCQSPTEDKKVACCLHGMPTFPHWHRLLAVQAENALRNHGYHGGLPYWDWTQPLTDLPEIVSPKTYVDPTNDKEVANPFYSAHIDDVNHDTVRSVRADLYQKVPFGEYTAIAKQVLLALEQDDFCDFEVQFEIAHNFIHALVGGSEVYSLASLAHTAYDPLFYLHHSNTDRLWAIWQALQKYKGKPYNSANCAVDKIRKPLAPFSLSSDVNPDPVTREHSLPFQVFDYKTNFHYEYDNLEFNGLTIPQLARVLEQNKAEDRVFAGFRLHGIRHSALTKFYICKKADDCDHLAGEFYLLGDANEMDWTYDRLYKYEITKQLEDLHLHYDDRYTIKYEIHDLDGTDLGHPFPDPTVIHDVGTSHIYGQEYRPAVTAASHVRHNLDDLSPGEVESLRAAFLAIQEDHSYEKIASFHGKPDLCEHEGRKVACCVHGNPSFPAWHRLYVEQVEHALLEHGSSVAIPYWDWTSPITKLPKLISKATYYNSRNQKFDPNPFFSGKIAGEDAVTTRDAQPQLFNNDYFNEQALYALEQDHFCDFEIQFEVLHNALHSWLGGRAKYSLSSLDYTAFDPVFFLHHANTDRIWAIWQELQRYRGLPYNEADCDINHMRKPLKPFGDKDNQDKITQKYSRPADTFDYRNHFEYEYDNLEFNHQTIPQLENLLKQRQKHGRVFAGFLIHNIGVSADVDIYICVPTGHQDRNNCTNKAGVFSILGGETEMPFEFDRLYKHDITKAVKSIGIAPNNAANFQLKIDIKAANGSHLDPHILHDPSIIYVPGTDEVEEHDGKVSPFLVRKNVESLNPLEGYHLVKALIALKADNSADGFQSIASFHAIPPLCPSPTASKRFACCIHGAASFLQWHRIYTVQFEQALKRHGSHVGVPYWDWTRISDHLPRTFTLHNYTDPFTDKWTENPFFKARIEFEDREIERDLQHEHLFQVGPHGWDTWLYNQALFALEQEDYCDFAIQLEITHNAIHSWIGGSKKHSMAHLHYASYDPAFFIHHSNTDRLWALWQALQKHRGHNPNEPNCALEKQSEPLKPFSFGPPYNLNSETEKYSHPEDTFDYESHYHYHYDTLEFVGMSIPVLDAYIRERKEHDRVFAGFFLKGVGRSVSVNFDICNAASDKCFPGGHFTLLGGSAEMPWEFDRLYKYEITDQLKDHGFRYDDDYHFKISVKGIDGTELDSHLIHEPSVIFVAGKHEPTSERVPTNHVRRNLNKLNERDIQSLQSALHDLEEDKTNDGWANLASFHGAPARCPDLAHPTVACCQHGMPTFPHWHRLFTLQVEQALRKHGSSVAIPYWDWTFPIKELPSIFTKEEYYDVWRDEVIENPFAHGYIPSDDTFTVRDVQSALYKTDNDGKHSILFNAVLAALEQTDYCDFEVHFEVMHNAIHFIIGGEQTYSLSSLEYSAYDPIFFIHHSFTDKIWVVWQELQRIRHLPYNRADCAVNSMNEPMKPFNFEGFNLNKFTREHAVPSTLFDHEGLGYAYDDLNIGGYSPQGLKDLIEEKQKHARVFAGFLLKGIKTSGVITLKLCQGDSNCTFAGRFSVLGGPTESPWAYDRLYKRDITQFLELAHLKPEDVFDDNLHIHLEVEVRDVEGHTLNAKSVLPTPTIIYDPPHTETKESHPKSSGAVIRKDVSHLTPKEVKHLRKALRKVQADSGPHGFQNIASFHGSPARCSHDGHPAACCIHGMANFPQWHRLYVKHWEDALVRQGAKIGIPYWEWTNFFTDLPELVTQKENNSFHHGVIYNGEITTRSPKKKLFQQETSSGKSIFTKQIELAFEQTDYCDFEVQFEITHNAIHSWVGGESPYSMSTLDYTAYDPLFLLHHSNVDRQFAIWQALQKFRGLPYNSANCDIQLLHQPMRPFSDSDNVNPTTRANSKASDVFDYDRLNYQYEDLHFGNLTISQLNDEIERNKEHDRIFAEFLLHGLETSANIKFYLHDADNNSVLAGSFAILGGPLEMPWSYDRRYKYDVTEAFNKLHLRPDSEYHFEDKIVAVNGTILDSHLIKPPSVHFVPGTKAHHPELKLEVKISDKLIRKNVNQLTLGEASNLKNALRKLQEDQGPGGFEAIAGFHGAPFLCPEKGDEKYACCVHGMPVFPHWHRLFTVQFEQALKQHGSSIGIPYWDWTAPGRALPPFLTDTSNNNPFSSYTIRFAGQKTTRSPLEKLFSTNTSEGHTVLYQLTLDALEEEDFCHFENTLEFLHNSVHHFIGGTNTYSMSTLDYSAFDPVFMIVHSSMDRIWVLWQELQKLRHKPYTGIDCADYPFHKPLHPFDFPAINTIALTRQHAVPNTIFTHSDLGYEYDNTAISGYDAEHVNDIIKKRQSKTRIYFGEAAFGLGISVAYVVWVLNEKGEKFEAGDGYLLGSSKEMPWTNEILFKYDITDAVHKAGQSVDKPIKFLWKSINYDGQLIETESDYGVIVVKEANTDYLTLNIPIGTNKYPLPPKLIVPKGTHIRFIPVSEEYNYPIENLVSLTNLDKCTIPPFSFDTYVLNKIYSLEPGDYHFASSNKTLCVDGKKAYIVVQDH